MRASQASAMLSVCCVLAACTSPGGAPRSAEAPISVASDSLYEFFVAECVEQRNLAWVREESARLRSSRCGFLQGPGEEGDCMQRNDGTVSWRVPTTAGSDVIVTMSWLIGQTPNDPYGPPDGHLSCSVDVPADLGPALQEVAIRVASQELPTVSPSQHSLGADEWWTWVEQPRDSRSRAIDLYHIGSGRTLHPWRLTFAPSGHVPGR